MEENKLQPEPLLDTSVASYSINASDGKTVLKYKKVEAREAVKKGTKLRILPVGDHHIRVHERQEGRRR
jgi:hypothetical protein